VESCGSGKGRTMNSTADNDAIEPSLTFYSLNDLAAWSNRVVEIQLTIDRGEIHSNLKAESLPSQ